MSEIPGFTNPSINPLIVIWSFVDRIEIAAAALPGTMVAPLATTTWVPGVVTVSPSVSDPAQVVVPFATVGSGAHCAFASAGQARAQASVLVPIASDRRRRRSDGAR
jgi:hypothetical protein